MINIAVAEDDKNSRYKLNEFLNKYKAQRKIDIKVDYYDNGLDLVEDYNPKYGIILLDIEMPHLNGIDTAKKIREKDTEAIIIFITNIAKYAIKGYEVQALDFVLKPVSYGAFELKLDKAISIIQSRKQENIVISTVDGMRKFMCADITYFEVQNHYLIIHTIAGLYKARVTLKEIENSLRGQNFAKCNKGYLVNLRHVDLLQNDIVIVAGDALIISRRKKEEFRQVLMDYYGGSRV